jgi:hypothetical protein
VLTDKQRHRLIARLREIAEQHAATSEVAANFLKLADDIEKNSPTRSRD